MDVLGIAEFWCKYINKKLQGRKQTLYVYKIGRKLLISIGTELSAIKIDVWNYKPTATEKTGSNSEMLFFIKMFRISRL